MRAFSLPMLVAASLSLAAPVTAQNNDFGNFVSGMAKSLIAQELELNAYRQAQGINTAEAYRDFIAQYPNGSQRASAERSLQRLGTRTIGSEPPRQKATPTNRSPAAIEASLRLTRSDRMQVQTHLKNLRYYGGPIDGLWGRDTRFVIGRWQFSNKQPETGYITRQQLDMIAQQAARVTTAAPAAPETFTNADALEESLLDLTLDERRDVQRRLTRMGYNTGGADGGFGRNTRRALAAWQSDEGERATGYITADQLRELRRQTGS